MDPTQEHMSPTRQALIEAALQVFLERGFARATTREIARRAGLSEGTMYRHFSDKYELFHEVFLSLVLEIGEELGRLPGRAGRETACLRWSVQPGRTAGAIPTTFWARKNWTHLFAPPPVRKP